jgi:SOS-response transcriptional repressor LexA
MSTLKDRFKDRRKALGYSQKEVARKTRISQNTISNIETGRNDGSKHIAILAHVLKCNAMWLLTGKGEEPTDELHLKRATDVHQFIPILSWSELDDSLENIETNDTEYVTLDVDSDNRTFALKVTGNSMEPIFKDGSTIILEQDIEAKNGDFVITKGAGKPAAFNQLIQNNLDWHLNPLNSRYPVTPLADHKIIGVVVKAIIKFR